MAFVTDGCLANGEPRRYDDLRRLNDGLRERGRRALVAYLCHLDRVALPWQPGHVRDGAGDLSDLLLLDVEAGVCEKASRIEEAITAAQSFIRRSPHRPGAGLAGDPRVRPAVGQPVRDVPDLGAVQAPGALP